MSSVTQDVWRRLDASVPAGELLTARYAMPDITNKLLAALDAENRRHILIQLQQHEDELHDDLSRGLNVITRKLVVKEHGGGRYIDICCNDPNGYAALDLIGGELAVGLSSAKIPPAKLVEVVLAKWRRFWGQLPHQMLSFQEQLGLFAELWFLSTWLAPHIGMTDAITPWRGPFGARHDFEWEARSIEVKATTSTRGRIHRINGLDQLTPPESGTLMVFSLRLREEAGASNNLPSLIASCRSKLETDPDTLDKFEDALLKARYSAAYDEEYAKLRLRVIDEALFHVKEDFPRITPASFALGCPAGVEHVEYEINLSGHDHLIAAENASAMSTLV